MKIKIFRTKAEKLEMKIKIAENNYNMEIMLEKLNTKLNLDIQTKKTELVVRRLKRQKST
jgi:hypothetical protein